jgi:glucose/arabinose dehydrogenase
MTVFFRDFRLFRGFILRALCDLPVKIFMIPIRGFCFCLVLWLSVGRSEGAPTFSVPGFVDEAVYNGNGMITLRFDPAGRLWVTEKLGRILVFTPNDSASSAFSYQYYEKPAGIPSWEKMPDFAALTPVKSGMAPNFSLDPRLRDDDFAFRFTGSISIPAAGDYTFYLVSDDGSRLFVDGKLVVDHDGVHGGTEKSGKAALAAGPHEVTVEYFDAGGGESLVVNYEGPGLAKGPLASGPFKSPVVFADFSPKVNTTAERGMLGLALDPDFARNRHLYVLYSRGRDQQIVRLTSNDAFTAMEPGSEVVLLEGLPNLNGIHKAGDIMFHPHDPKHLYAVIGDDGDRNKVDDLTNYWGKILRINAADGKGLADNPFFDGDVNSVQSRVWSKGYRNPFRFAFDPAAPIEDVVYVSENGDGTDRLVRIEKGAEGGWPRQFEKSSEDGKRTVMNMSDPSKTAIAILRGAPFAPGDAPVLYAARYGGGDRSEVRRWTLTGPKLDHLEPLEADQGRPFYIGYTGYNIVSFQIGPDGALYYTDSNQGDSKGNGYRLGRIRFVGGTAPVAAFSAAPAEGAAPLKVEFNDSSSAPKSSLSTWSWNFGDGETSTQPHPGHVYARPGVYTVALTVTNAQKLNNTTESKVTVFQEITLGLTGTILDARTPEAKPLAAATELRFYQKDGRTPFAFKGGAGPKENVLPIPAGGVIKASVTGRIIGDGIVISAGEAAGDGVQAAYDGVPLSLDEKAHSAEVVFRLSDTLLRGRVVDTKLQPARIDLGVSRGSPGTPYGFAGGRDFLPGSGTTPSKVPHRIVPDALGYYHVPIATGQGNETFHLDTTADTLVATHGRVHAEVRVNNGQAAVQNLTIGLYDGGTGEDDLSKIFATPDVDFETQIQPIFTSSCVGCHDGIATNSAGLDLQKGVSFDKLVNHESAEAPGIKLVEPGSPERSYLMEKINSTSPQVGTSMRPGDPMLLKQRALIRDWIRQLKSDTQGK